jgi:hypothetical protein
MKGSESGVYSKYEVSLEFFSKRYTKFRSGSYKTNGGMLLSAKNPVSIIPNSF